MKQKIFAVLVFVMCFCFVNGVNADTNNIKDMAFCVDIQEEVISYIQERVNKHLEIAMENPDVHGISLNSESELEIGWPLPIYTLSTNRSCVRKVMKE